MSSLPYSIRGSVQSIRLRKRRRVLRGGGSGTQGFLDLYIQFQSKPNWCWAAIASSLGAIYQTQFLSQCQIAEQLTDVDCCPPDWYDPAGNWEQSLEDALQVVGLKSLLGGYFQLPDIQAEIDQGRPIVATIDWSQSNANHFVVIDGYFDHGIEKIHICDPLFGDRWIPLDEFTLRYRPKANHTPGEWVETHRIRRI